MMSWIDNHPVYVFIYKPRWDFILLLYDDDDDTMVSLVIESRFWVRKQKRT